jgi:DNA-binding protein YbaB
MSLRPFVFAISLAAALPAFAQDTSLSTELADVERQLTEIDAQAARYDGGLILTLIEARREALLLARTLIENRINAEAGGATVEVTVPAVQPDEARASQILVEMAAAQQRIEEAEREAAIGGGLIQALALSRAETERLTLAQLRMGYLQAKYGIAFPVMVAQARILPACRTCPLWI